MLAAEGISVCHEQSRVAGLMTALDLSLPCGKIMNCARAVKAAICTHGCDAMVSWILFNPCWSRTVRCQRSISYSHSDHQYQLVMEKVQQHLQLVEKIDEKVFCDHAKCLSVMRPLFRITCILASVQFQGWKVNTRGCIWNDHDLKYIRSETFNKAYNCHHDCKVLYLCSPFYSVHSTIRSSAEAASMW